MALNLNLSNAAANAEANALAALLNTGYLRIYDGTQPATADTAITTQTLLAELRFGATAFGSASAGVITANSITSATATATSTATWARCFESDGTTTVMDFSVGTSTANLILTTTSIVSGSTVAVSSFIHTVTE